MHRKSLAVHTYSVKGGRIRALFFHDFLCRNLSVTLLNVARFLQLVLGNSPAKVQKPCELSMRTTLDAQFYFHTRALMIREVRRKKPNIIHNALNSTLVDVELQDVQEVWDALTKSCSFGPLRVVVRPYLRFNPAVIQFEILLQL